MKRFLLISVLLAFSVRANADDLMDIYRRAQLNDPTWNAARANYAANVERLTQGRAGLLPSVGLNASTIKSDQRVTTPSGTSDYDYRTDAYTIQLTQPLYRKQNLAAYAQGQAVAEQAEADLANARQDLILRSTQVYLAALNAQDVADFARAEKASLERLRGLAQRNFSVGTATLVDVHESQSAYDLAVAQEIAAENDLQIRREALRTLTGEAPGTLSRFSATFDLAGPTPGDLEKWVEASRDNPQVKAQEKAVESARQELEKSVGRHYPTLDFVASHNYSDAGGSTLGFPIESTTNQVGLVLQMSLYEGGIVASRVRESAARRDEAEARLESVRRQASQQVREQYLTVLNGVARVKALERAQGSLQRALESTVLGYERGLRANIDIVNAQRDLFRTRRDLSQARYDYFLARLRLQAAVGQLADDNLDDINRMFAGR